METLTLYVAYFVVDDFHRVLDGDTDGIPHQWEFVKVGFSQTAEGARRRAIRVQWEQQSYPATPWAYAPGSEVAERRVLDALPRHWRWLARKGWTESFCYHPEVVEALEAANGWDWLVDPWQRWYERIWASAQRETERACIEGLITPRPGERPVHVPPIVWSEQWLDVRAGTAPPLRL